MMVVAYALGVFAPAVAFAHADHDLIVHVLSESHGGMLVLHFHDHTGDRHDPPAKPGGGAHHCCGVISLPALEPSAAVAIMWPKTKAALIPPPSPSLSGCGARRLDVEPQQVVLGQAEFADGCLIFYPTVRTMPVVSMEPEGEFLGAMG